MIDESWVWRRGLNSAAARINTFMKLQRYRENSFAITEREIMVGFFAVRKLIDSKSKVSGQLAARHVPVGKFAAIKPMGSYERFEFYEYFDLSNSNPSQITISYLSNQVIHSLLFNFSWDDNGKPEGVYLASDYDRTKHCFHISLQEIAKIFEITAASYTTDIALDVGAKSGRNIIALN